MEAQSVEQLQKIVQKMVDKDEIRRVMAMHEYYHSAVLHKEEVDDIWAMEMPDVRFSINTCVFEGSEKLREFYVNTFEQQKKLNQAAGSLVYHCLTTDIIEVAEDGKTATGIWMTPGIVTGVQESSGKAMWVYEKYGVDFIKLDGKWKIWHLHTYTDFYCPWEKCWTENPENYSGGNPPVEPTRWVRSYNEYTVNTVPQFIPKPPEPFKTFDPGKAH
jgi:hypothetical protein